MVFCTSCGHENPDDARFCSSCGSPLAERSPTGDPTAVHTAIFGVDSDSEDAESSEALPAGALAMLVIRQGPKKGSRIALGVENSDIYIGRHPESDIFLDDITVSRRHATVRLADQKFMVEDAGSLNGTYVNQELVDEYQLAHEDELQVGKFKLVFLDISGDA